MNEENPLRRAHALSAEASVLLKPPNAPLAALEKALAIYQQAAMLFESAISDMRGEEEKKTLQLLVTQHRRMARDVERRISVCKRTIQSSGSSPPAGYRVLGESSTGLGAGRGAMPPRRGSVGLGSANIASFPNGLGSRVTANLGVPPFALRPGMQQIQQPPLNRASTSPQTNTSISHIPSVPHPTTSDRLGGSGGHPALSPMHSSSSSDESYLNLGAIPDTLDPFSRFWGMLENMLDDISNPVVFASAPLGIGEGIVGAQPTAATLERARKKKRAKEKDKERQRRASPSESFYVVPSLRSGSEGEEKADAGAEGDSDSQSTAKAPGKTPEELALENENLRKSLDALALHTESVERANKQLREQAEEQGKMMRSVAVGIRREAQKALHGQEMYRSQLLASVTSNSPRSAPRTSTEAKEKESDNVLGLRKRIRELEEEVNNLKAENVKQKGQVEKYRDRFHQLKVNARAKKEAKQSEPTTAFTKSAGSSKTAR